MGPCLNNADVACLAVSDVCQGQRILYRAKIENLIIQNGRTGTKTTPFQAFQPTGLSRFLASVCLVNFHRCPSVLRTALDLWHHPTHSKVLNHQRALTTIPSKFHYIISIIPSYFSISSPLIVPLYITLWYPLVI